MYDSCANSLFIGKKIVYLPSCHSTNDIAAELVRSGEAPEGTVVITDRQTAGRGQRGSRWVTDTGLNFTLSLVLTPVFLSVSEHFLLSQATALGVRNYVAGHTSRCQIKWPNDLLVNGLKIGGILIENAWQGARLSHSVVGVGLNVNQSDFPGLESAATGATSVRLETGQRLHLPEELPRLLVCLEKNYLLLRAGHRETVRQKYLEHLAGHGSWRHFEVAGRVVEAKVEGVTPAGKLAALLADGTRREFDVKEIKWLREH